MSILTYFKAGTIALVIGLGVTAWHQRDERMREQGRNEILAERLDSMRAQVVEDSIQIARTDSAAQARIDWAEDQRAEAERLANEARARRPAIVERIVHAPDTTAIRAAVEELEAEHETEVLSLREAIAQADSVIRAKDEQIEARDRALVQVRSALRAALEVSAANAERGFLEGAVGQVTLAAGGALIGWGANELRHGGG